MPRVIVNGRVLDYTPDDVAPLAVTIAVADVEDISKRSGVYSKTFSLPATNNNNQALEHLHFPDVDADSTSIAFGRTSCQIESGGHVWLDGYARVRGASLDLQPIGYDMEIFGGNSDWVAQIKEEPLSGLDYERTFDFTRASLTGHNSSLSGGYCFPIVDRGSLYSAAAVHVTDMAPAYFVSDVVTKIFSGIGYTVESNWLTASPIDDMIMVGGAPTISTATSAEFISTSDVTGGGLNGYAFQGSGTTNDPFNQFTASTSSLDFDPAYNQKGYYTVSVDITGYTVPSSTVVFNVHPIINGGLQLTTTLVQGEFTVDGSGNGGFVADTKLTQVNVGATYGVYVLIGTVGNNYSIVDASVLWNPANSDVIAGAALDVAASMPDQTQFQFLKALQSHCNLVFDADAISRTVRIEPRNDWRDLNSTVQTGYYKGPTEAIDWTDKLDVSDPIKTEFLTQYNDRVKFVHEESDRWHNEEYDRINNIRYGTQIYDFPNHYQPGITEIEAKGMAAYMRYNSSLTNSGQLSTPVMLNDEPGSQTNEFSQDIYLMTWGYGAVTDRFGADVEYNFYSDDGTTSAQYTNVPQAWSVNLDDDTQMQTTFNSYGGGKGLVDRFYSKTLDDLRNRVKFVAKFNLKDSDILPLLQDGDLSRPIYLESFGYFYINKIADYKPGTNEPTRVELFEARFGGRESIGSTETEKILSID